MCIYIATQITAMYLPWYHPPHVYMEVAGMFGEFQPLYEILKQEYEPGMQPSSCGILNGI